VFDNQHIHLSAVPFLDGPNHFSVVFNRLVDPPGEKPGMVPYNVGFGVKIINHLAKITIPTGLENRLVEFRVFFDHLVGPIPHMPFDIPKHLFQILDFPGSDVLNRQIRCDPFHDSP
jgi:hypothetical protein